MAFPSISTVVDDFNRADGLVTVGSTVWQAGHVGGAASGLRVISNALGADSNSLGQLGSTNTNTFETFFDVVETSISYLGFFFSLQNPTTAEWEGYWLLIDGTHWKIRKRIANVISTVQEVALGNPNAGDKIGIRKSPGLIEVFRYTSGAWNQTPIVSANDTDFAGGTWAFELGNSAWRLDNLVLDEIAAVGGTGPDAAVTIYVNPDHANSSDTYTRGIAMDAGSPLKTIQRAGEIVRASPTWADTILVTKAVNANAADPNGQTGVYARVKANTIMQEGVPGWAFADNTGNLPIVLKGAGSAPLPLLSGARRNPSTTPDNRPRMQGLDLVRVRNWIIEDIHIGYEYNSGFDVLTYSIWDLCGPLTFRRCKWTGGGADVLNPANPGGAAILWEDCEITARYSVFGGADGRGGDGRGFRVIKNSVAGEDFRGSLIVRRCFIHDVQGEDAFALGMGAPDQIDSEFIAEDSLFLDVVIGQGDTRYGVVEAHTDCIQVLGGPSFTIRRNVFDNYTAAVNATDYRNGLITIENNLFIGRAKENPNWVGIAVSVQGTTELRIFHNTSMNNGYGIALSLYYKYTVPNGMLVHMANNVWDGVQQSPDFVKHVNSTDQGNLIGQAFGVYSIPPTNTEGIAEFGTSSDTAWELATLPAPSLGIDAGVPGVVNAPTLDRLGRAYGPTPNMGCHADPPEAVTAYSRGPILLNLAPANGSFGVDRFTHIRARIYPMPTVNVDSSTLNAQTIYLLDPGNQKIPGAISLNQGTGIFTLDLEGSLYPFVKYTAWVIGGAAGIKDVVGRPLQQTYSWSFEIGGTGTPAYRTAAEEPSPPPSPPPPPPTPFISSDTTFCFSKRSGNPIEELTGGVLGRGNSGAYIPDDGRKTYGVLKYPCLEGTMAFIIKENATRPTYVIQLREDVGKPTERAMDLRTATGIQIVMRRTSATPQEVAHLKEAATIMFPDALPTNDEEAGWVEFTWPAGSTSPPDNYYAEFDITWGPGATETVPNSGYFAIIVEPDLEP